MAELKRILGLRDLLLLVVGSVIGSGIFLVPGDILRDMNGSVLLALLVWVLGGLLSLLGALTYGEMAALQPQAGGVYIYIRDAFGALPAFLYGWTMFTLIATGALATLSVAFSNYLGELVPLTPATSRIASLGMIAVVVAVNVRGTRQGADVQNVSTLIKAGAVLLMSLALLALGREYPAVTRSLLPADGGASVWARFGLSMIAALWAYEAWQYATFSAGETRDPQRNFPRAFLGAMLALIAIYLLANAAYFVALGPAAAMHTERIAATAVNSALHPSLGKILSLAILISAFSAANAIQLTAPRVFFAMARDGLFFRKLTEVHPRFETPAFAIFLSGAWAMVLSQSGTFRDLYTYVVVASWVFYALAGGSIFYYRRALPGAERAYRVPGYPWTPALFVLAAIGVVVASVAALPKDWKFYAAFGIALAGIPVYFVWKRRNAQRAAKATAAKPGPRPQ
jgi:APA family basic amino acid/polyamine antiporter